MLYLVIFLLLSFLILILFIKVNILIEYLREGWNDNIIISFFILGGLIKYKFEIPLIDIDKTGLKLRRIKEKGKDEKDIDKDKKFYSFIDMYKKIKEIKRYYDSNKEIIVKVEEFLKEKLILHEYSLNVVIGTGDAFYTSILNGIAWTITGILSSYLFMHFKVQKKYVSIKADFNAIRFNLDLYCIFKVKLVYIIIITLNIFKMWFIKKYMVKNMIGGDIVD